MKKFINFQKKIILTKKNQKIKRGGLIFNLITPKIRKIPQVSLFTFAFIASTLAAPLDDSKDAQIISADSEQTLNGYRFR
jgi:hypothetical protein